jgi:hypothetical protein
LEDLGDTREQQVRKGKLAAKKGWLFVTGVLI